MVLGHTIFHPPQKVDIYISPASESRHIHFTESRHIYFTRLRKSTYIFHPPQKVDIYISPVSESRHIYFTRLRKSTYIFHPSQKVDIYISPASESRQPMAKSESMFTNFSINICSTWSQYFTRLIQTMTRSESILTARKLPVRNTIAKFQSGRLEMLTTRKIPVRNTIAKFHQLCLCMHADILI
jgi:hypothetical protein